MFPDQSDDDLLTSAAVRQRLGGISDMALFRWQRDPRVGFPAADYRIGRRIFWRRSTIDQWLLTRATGAQPAPRPRIPA